MNKITKILKKNVAGWILILPVVLALILFKWSPIVEGFIKSFFSTKGYETLGFVGLENYKDILTDTLFIKTLLNTVKYVLWSLVIGVAPPIIMAFLLNEVKFINKFFRAVTYLPALAPSVAIALIWTQLYNPASYGMLNSILTFCKLPAQEWLQNPKIAIPLLIVMSTWSGAPGTAVIYLAKMQEVRTDLYEAAFIDGASIWHRFRAVMWPHISSTVLLIVARQIIGVFQIMEQPLLMTGGGPDNATMTLSLTAYNYAFTYMRVSHSLALGACMFIILATFTVVYFKLEKKTKEWR